jgi:hypothetical protein
MPSGCNCQTPDSSVPHPSCYRAGRWHACCAFIPEICGCLLVAAYVHSSLVLLFAGIAQVNLSSAKERVQSKDQNQMLGFVAVQYAFSCDARQLTGNGNEPCCNPCV